MIRDHGYSPRDARCECWRCVNARPWPKSTSKFDLKWGIEPLLGHTTIPDIKLKFGFNRLIAWRNHGVPDAEADSAAIHLAAMHPAQIWTGWHEAAEDYFPT